jgi:CRISPR system Cascade subunit CasA
MTPTTPRFNLIDEPWIPVQNVDGSIAEVSLRDAFRSADRIRELDGELPTQVFALTRLLVAVLYRATVSDDGAGWDRGQWQGYWRDGLPLREIDDYLDAVHDRFWLIHPERPFFQVPDLAAMSGEVKDTSALILDVPSKPLFTNRSGAASLGLRFAEAARWLVNAQAFDASGIKTGAVGDPRVKGGRGYPQGQAWAGHLGGILLEGADLRETLLLNFVVPGEEAFAIDADADIPPWEDDVPDTSEARAGLRPHGPIRLATWQSRRIRLVADGDLIVGCVLAYGDPLTPQNQFRHEAMTAWRYSEPQSKKAGVRTYMPREHLPGRAFWRGIAALLPRTEATNDLALQPATLGALGDRRLSGAIADDAQIGIRAIGVLYGTQQAVIDDIVDDRLDIAIALLREEGAALAVEAENAVSRADDGVRALRRLAENLVRAAGGSPDDAAGQRARVEAAAYARLDGAYRTWLAGLTAGTVPAEAITDWKQRAYRHLRELGSRLVRDSSPTAWEGREIRSLQRTELVNTSRAEIWFLRALDAALGTSREPQSQDADDTSVDSDLDREATT